MKNFVKLIFQNSGPIFLLLLLISCKSNALHSLTDRDFNTFLLSAEQLNDTDPKAALLLLASHKDELNSQPLTNQVNYYRIQSAAYADQALYTLSEASAEQGLKRAKKMNNPSIFIAELIYTKGFSLENLGDFDGAFQLYKNGLDVARSMKSEELTARGLINIGAILYLKKDYKQSLITLNQALIKANELADEALLGDISRELGILYGYLGQESQANDYFYQSYQYFKKAGKHNYALNSLHNVAINHANQENFQQAISVYRVLEREIKQNTSNEFIASVYQGIAWALLNKENADTQGAYRYIMLAGEYIKDVEHYLVKFQYLIDKTYVLDKMERYQEALINLEQAKLLLERKAIELYDGSELNVLFLSAKLHYALGHYNQAYQIQTLYFTQSIAHKLAQETTETDELRLQYESETAQRKKNILQKKQRIQNLQLEQMANDATSRQVFVAVLAIGILILLWFLFHLIKSQRNSLRATHTGILTGESNRRRLLELGEEYFLAAKMDQQAFSVYMMNIDFLKKINVQVVNSISDKVLKEITIQSQSLMRTSDVFGRFGNEEFMALLPNTRKSEACAVAHRLRQNIEQIKWQSQQVNQLTVSIAVATFERDNYANFSALLKSANEQLLKTKLSGHKVCYDE